MIKILVVGQTPPPYGGQALMIDYMLKAGFEHVEFYHVRMCFSREMNERGKMSIYKITHLIDIIRKSIYLRFKHNIGILYYPPSNSPTVSVFRDLIFLAFTRPFFKKTIFHFHAAGISEYIPTMQPLLQKVARGILNKPDLGITSSLYNPHDGFFLKAKKEVVIPLGVPDILTAKELALKKTWNGTLHILFVGLLNATKGEGYLLDAVYKLSQKGYNIKLSLAGKFETEAYKDIFFNQVKTYKLEEKVDYLGVVTGDAKQKAFLEADLFCFPSFFVSESFGIVLLEAMLFNLPIIATRWRGIQSIVEDGKNGFLVDIKNSNQLADKIEVFLKKPELIDIMGQASRALYLDKYTLLSYIQNLEKAFLKI
ncbi:glycosyltransferase family 4 protein [Parasediminibacterium sp. JCM 36343]|uniref:glycosyltransferase family 4 protein n=1 Tax=Parasediminibacterium sp. JCM 36343 TaxID=3374279 RepID=UPI00397A6049